MHDRVPPRMDGQALCVQKRDPCPWLVTTDEDNYTTLLPGTGNTRFVERRKRLGYIYKVIS